MERIVGVVFVIMLVLLGVVAHSSTKQSIFVNKSIKSHKKKMILPTVDSIPYLVFLKYVGYSFLLTFTGLLVIINFNFLTSFIEFLKRLINVEIYQMVVMILFILISIIIIVILIYLCMCTYDRLICISLKATNTLSIVIIALLINSTSQDNPLISLLQIITK